MKLFNAASHSSIPRQGRGSTWQQERWIYLLSRYQMQDQTLSGSHPSHLGHGGRRMGHQDPQCGSTVTCPLALQISSATDSCTGIVPHQQHPVPHAIAHTENHPVPEISACTENQSSSSTALSPGPRQHPSVTCMSWGPPLHHLVTQADAAPNIGAPALLQTNLD